MGENPVVGSMNGPLQRKGLRKLDWLVVRDFQVTETADFWREAPEIERGEVKPEEIPTEVFFFPAAAHTEKDGSFTNTQRLLQWHHKAIEPKGDARSELDFIFKLGQRLKKLYANEYASRRNWPIRDLTWDYPTHGPLEEPSAEAVLFEVNGYTVADRKTGGGLHVFEGRWLDGVRLLDLLGLLPRRTEPDRAAQAALGAELGGAGVGVGVAAQSPGSLQSRFGRSRMVNRGPSESAWFGGMKRKASGRATIRPISLSSARLPIDHRKRLAGKIPFPASTRSSCRRTERAGSMWRRACRMDLFPRTMSPRNPS